MIDNKPTPPANDGGPAHIVLSHTLPPGSSGIRAEEAAFRQYNSCVDFTFQESLSCGNARRLKRLNAIFERAADRHSGGVREDKLLRIMPSGTAPKYGIDPVAVKRRQQERREQLQQNQEAGKTSSDEEGNQNKKQQGRKAVSDSSSSKTTNVRIISRGTFLAMFANESSTFINTMGQNENADRKQRIICAKINGAVGHTRDKRSQKSASTKRKPQAVSDATAQTGLSPLPGARQHGTIIDQETRDAPSKKKSSRSRRSRKDRGLSKHKDRRQSRKSRNTKNESLSALSSVSQSSSGLLPASKSSSWSGTSGFDANMQLNNSEAESMKHTPEQIVYYTENSDIRAYGRQKREYIDLQPGSSGAVQPPSSETCGHSADEAGGGSSANYQAARRLEQRREETKHKDMTMNGKELSREEKKALRRKKKRAKEEARRLEVARELILVEQRKRMLEEERVHMSMEDKHHKSVDECAFLSSVASVLKNFIPSMGNNRAAVAVAPAEENMFYGRLYTGSHLLPKTETQLLHFPKSPHEQFHPNQHMPLSPLPPGEYSLLQTANRTASASFSSHSTSDSLIGESVVSGCNSPQAKKASRRVANAMVHKAERRRLSTLPDFKKENAMSLQNESDYGSKPSFCI